MDLALNKRRALVMGASSGLGFAIAQALRNEGANVAISARGGDRLTHAAAVLGAHAVAADMADAGAATRLVEAASAQLGGLDILVVNMGGPPTGTFDSVGDDIWQAGFQSLLLAAVQAIRTALPPMRSQRWGRILVVTSTSAREALPNLLVSNVLRPALHGLINTLSKEVAAEGITVNALMPGFIATERLKNIGLATAESAQRIPAKRFGKPEELGALAAFLASEQAAYITGQAIACDGGLLASI